MTRTTNNKEMPVFKVSFLQTSSSVSTFNGQELICHQNVWLGKLKYQQLPNQSVFVLERHAVNTYT